MSVFKPCDIRGVYPEELDERIAERIGRAVATELGGAQCVVAGDVQAKTLRPKVRHYCGRYRRAKRPFENLDTQTRWAGSSSRIIEKDVRDTYAVLAFPAPSMARRRDTVIMDVILAILGEGRSSRLYRTLREEKKLVSSVSVGYATPKKPGLFMVFATLKAEDLDAMHSATLEEIRRIRTQRVGRRELAKAKKMRTNEYYFANETTNGQTESLGLYYILSDSEKYEIQYLREVARVTAADVRRVARQYLDPERMTLVALQPKADRR